MVQDKSLSSRLVDFLNTLFLIIISLLCILPFLHILAGSLAPVEEAISKDFILWPSRLSLEAYQYVFSTGTIIRSMLVTIGVTIVGTFINILFTSWMAYALSRTQLKGRNVILFAVVFTMLFQGGIIPTYLVVRGLGLLNTYLSLILPVAVSAFNLVVMKNFYQQIPKELEESAKMDGANDLYIFFSVMVPLSLAAISTFSLFYAVGHWNQYFSAVLYIRDSTKWPLQVLLRQIVILSEVGVGDSDSEFVMPQKSVQMATIVVATVPILIVYPLLQKHFIKGVMLGSIKG